MPVSRKMVIPVLCIVLYFICGHAFASGLPMDDFSWGPRPKKENYITTPDYAAYQDDSITVRIYTGRFADTTYNCAHVKISHPSQLRTAPAGIIDSDQATFRSATTSRGRHIANKVNAVVAVNGDYHIKSDKSQVVFRMGQQFRNAADGTMDLLIIDQNGNLCALEKCTKADYIAYARENLQNMYQVFCFGPVLCRDGKSVIGADYFNHNLISQTSAQRTAIAQLGELEYLIITCEGPQSADSKGMTLMEFASLCETLGTQFRPEGGCALAFNLDGGNSSSLIFKGLNDKGDFAYIKYNCPEIERSISDILYFATLDQ